jgi:hypothetical protein
MKRRSHRIRRRKVIARLSMGIAAFVALAGLSATIFVQNPQPVFAASASVFPESTTPQLVTDPDRQSVELGVRFSSSVDIAVTGIQFYKGSRNSGKHVGTLWSSSGNVLSRVSFSNETRSGWQTATFTTPVAVKAGKSYVASYWAPRGRYSADIGGFRSARTDGTVTFPKGAGVYTYRSGTFPTANYLNSNYYVDIVYTAASTPPVVVPPVVVPPVVVPPVVVPPVVVPPVVVPPSDGQPGTGPTMPPVDPTIPPVDPSVPPTSGNASLALPREAWWGGSAYYSKFAMAKAAGWTDPGFFPISVFFGKPEQAKTLAGIGINTYMGAEHDGSAISTITSQGISVIAQDEWSRAEIGSNPQVVGWHASDECDMGLGGCDSAQGELGSLALQKKYVSDLRAYNDGRFIQANFGNGVLGSYWSPTTMDDHLALMDVSSVDKYAYTSPAARSVMIGSPEWPAGKNPATASAYGWLQDRMETFMSPAASKPNWIFVETAKPYLSESGATTITGDQIEGAVWNGIIHGAAGIAYFQHNNNGCGNYSLVDCSAALRTRVGAIDAQVKSLATVINTQSYVWSFGPQLETSLKTKDGSAYVFAMTDGSTGTRTFRLPAGVTGNVEVVGEGRSISVVGGKFTDSFASEFTHHTYRIALD